MTIRFLTAAVVLMSAVAAAAPLSAAPKKVTIKAFFGHFKGRGITKSSAAEYYGLSNRDMDVTIADAGAGAFRVQWTTIRRRRKGLKKASTVMTFSPTDNPLLWRAQGSGDIISGKRMAWARIEGRALLIYVAGIRKQTGRLHVSIYSRRLAPAGLYLQFRRIEEGRPVRFVEALLRRIR